MTDSTKRLLAMLKHEIPAVTRYTPVVSDFNGDLNALMNFNPESGEWVSYSDFLELWKRLKNDDP